MVKVGQPVFLAIRGDERKNKIEVSARMDQVESFATRMRDIVSRITVDVARIPNTGYVARASSSHRLVSVFGLCYFIFDDDDESHRDDFCAA